MQTYSKTCDDQQARMGARSAIQKSICGAVIFVDLDRYLSYVENLRPDREWAFTKPIYKIVEIESASFGITLTRTFGDGFLFYVESEINKRLLENCMSFLASLRDRLSKYNGMTFKASVVAGLFVRTERIGSDGLREIILAGAPVNFAGKQIVKAERRSLFVSWLLSGCKCYPLSFLDISRSNPSRRVITVDMLQAESVSAIWPNVPWTDESLAPPSRTVSDPDILKFVNDTKTLMFDSIKLADDKAKAVFAVSAAFLVYLFNSVGWPKFSLVLTFSVQQGMAILTLVSAIVALLTSTFFSLRVVIPRMQTSYDRGFVFFGSIANWSSGDKYADAVISTSIGDLRRESARHNYELAGVATKKFRALNRCLRAMGIGVALGLVYIVLTWDFSPLKPVSSSAIEVSSNASTRSR
jgi:hypothetical protein